MVKSLKFFLRSHNLGLLVGATVRRDLKNFKMISPLTLAEGGVFMDGWFSGKLMYIKRKYKRPLPDDLRAGLMYICETFSYVRYVHNLTVITTKSQFFYCFVHNSETFLWNFHETPIWILKQLFVKNLVRIGRTLE